MYVHVHTYIQTYTCIVLSANYTENENCLLGYLLSLSYPGVFCLSLSLASTHTYTHMLPSFLSCKDVMWRIPTYIFPYQSATCWSDQSDLSTSTHYWKRKKTLRLHAYNTANTWSISLVRPGPARCGLVWFILLNLPTSFSGVKMNILFTQLSSARVRSNHIRSDWISLDQASCLVIASRSTSEIKPSNRSLGHGSVGFGRVAPPLPCSGRLSFSFCGAYLRVRSGD